MSPARPGDFAAALLTEAPPPAGADRPALVLDRGPCLAPEIVSFAELLRRAQDVAARLEGWGLLPGHRLALSLPPGAELLAVLLGALRRGLLVSLLSPGLGPLAREHRLHHLDPDLVIDRPGQLPDGVAAEELLGTGPPPLRRPRSPQAALLLWTSGTSGQPKGVVLTAEAVLWNARSNAAVLGLLPSDRALVVLDMAYCYALIHQILSHFAVGASVALPAPSAPLPQIGRTAARLGATTLAVVPSLLQTPIGLPWLGEAAPGLRLLTIGGATAPEILLQRASEAFPRAEIYVTYGLTEAGPRACTRRYQAGAAALPGTVGLPLPGVQIRVGEDDELLLRSPSACAGYLHDGAFTPAPPWLPTGDRGEVLADGSVRVLGRLRPVINRAGVKLPPGEIEHALCVHPLVEQARVVPMRHPRLGEVPHAYVVPRATPPSPAALMEHCGSLLGAAWVPARIDLVASLPTEVPGWKDARG